MMTMSTVRPKPDTAGIAPATPTVRLKPDTTGITAHAAAILLLVSGVSGWSRIVSAQTLTGDLDPRIVKLVGAVSEERLGVILKKLESFETRSSLSSTTSTTRGIGAARQWILNEMSSYSPQLKVSFDTYQRRAGQHLVWPGAGLVERVESRSDRRRRHGDLRDEAALRGVIRPGVSVVRLRPQQAERTAVVADIRAAAEGGMRGLGA